MESYNPVKKRKDLEPKDLNQSKHIKLSTESNQPNQPYSTPTSDPDPAISFDDEQTLLWVKQLLGVQEDPNTIENIDSQNNNDLLSIDPEILPLLHIDDATFPLAKKNEHHSKSLDENDDMQYIKGRHVNTKAATLFRKDLIVVIKEFKKNHDEVNAGKYRDLLHQASQYDHDDIVWFTGEKIGFKANEKEFNSDKSKGKFIYFCRKYKKLRRQTIQSLPTTVKKSNQSHEPISESVDLVTKPVNANNETQKDRTDISSAEMNDMQYIIGRVNAEGAKLFRTDLIAVINVFAKNNDTVNARKYRDLLYQASREYDYNDIVWFTGEKIGFKATEEEIEKYYKQKNRILGKFKNFFLSYKTLRREIVQSIPVTVKESNQSPEPISESVNLAATQLGFFQQNPPIRSIQTIEHQDANSLLLQMNQRRA